MNDQKDKNLRIHSQPRFPTYLSTESQGGRGKSNGGPTLDQNDGIISLTNVKYTQTKPNDSDAEQLYFSASPDINHEVRQSSRTSLLESEKSYPSRNDSVGGQITFQHQEESDVSAVRHGITMDQPREQMTFHAHPNSTHSTQSNDGNVQTAPTGSSQENKIVETKVVYKKERRGCITSIFSSLFFKIFNCVGCLLFVISAVVILLIYVINF